MEARGGRTTALDTDRGNVKELTMRALTLRTDTINIVGLDAKVI
jgi:hypothetical protein